MNAISKNVEAGGKSAHADFAAAYKYEPDFHALVMANGHYPLLAAAFATIYPDTPAARMLTERAQLMVLHSVPLPSPLPFAVSHGDTDEFWEKIHRLEAPFRGNLEGTAGALLHTIFMLENELEGTCGEEVGPCDLVRYILAQASEKMTGATTTPVGTKRAAEAA
ncbi:hypothetical protein [Parvibaculum sp.]|uniref:hypothetical protein n=1 Tax=Parvibaculum sp. TaxID=2024848 RepID=UPI00391C80F9